ncbi:unnamed protein product [Cuscuta campestris]|uniref:Uncharacterized protein n=1 Tax=Cuscuta campestris TaxID=132261 RepID=A0A484MY80_9ASTE|nr:unnamed protein product [Cuscuta campestris]
MSSTSSIDTHKEIICLHQNYSFNHPLVLCSFNIKIRCIPTAPSIDAYIGGRNKGQRVYSYFSSSHFWHLSNMNSQYKIDNMSLTFLL